VWKNAQGCKNDSKDAAASSDANEVFHGERSSVPKPTSIIVFVFSVNIFQYDFTLNKKKRHPRTKRPETWHRDLRDSLSDLRWFIAFAEKERVDLAGKRLRIKPQNVSGFLKKFEQDEIGVPLVRHRGNALKLTEAGKLFRGDAIKLCDAYEAAKRRARAQAGIWPPKIHVGYPGSPVAEFFEPTIARYEERFQGVEVVRHKILVPDCFRELLANELDLALIVQPQRVDSRLIFKRLTDYPPMCVVGKHRLASKTAVRTNDLRNEHFLIFNRAIAPGYYRYFRDWLAQLGIVPRQISDDYDDVETLLPAVAAGRGIALLLSVSELEARRLGAKVKFLPIEPNLPRTNVGAVYVNPLMEHSAKFLEFAEDILNRTPAMP
jgi:DNA-binding transcriptional LysR family regulator